ncbi:hypothetical protein GCM10009067_41570 [Haloarcula sebkhae]|uniref:Uncharacterized protein n=1 Tax=Haloarcula sebkhae TaxID=932660 RepID=A0A830F582_9EURY|nr:hypothetical protein GCM10009067_41570 [Haloarcula sebkhae]
MLRLRRLNPLSITRTNRPPVPLDLPQNMALMDIAADAMNKAIQGSKTAQEALDTAASEMTRILDT